MPRSYRKKAGRAAKKGKKIVRRRLQGEKRKYGGSPIKPTNLFRGTPKRSKRARRGTRIGQAAADSTSGHAGHFLAGKAKRMGTILQRRKRAVLNTLADMRYPVIKDRFLAPLNQIDWAASEQACVVYDCGYRTGELEGMLTQANYAQTLNVASAITPNVDTVSNQRMDVYDKTVKFHMKNTCTHTVHIEIIAYEAKTHHSYTMLQAWQAAMTQDGMNQMPALWGTEQTAFNIGNRPDFRMADLNVRFRKKAGSTYKVVLEPGMETSYTYVQRGRRFDQQKYNVLQGSMAVGVDTDYLPGLSSNILVFARSELITDATDADVTFGSGHIAINKEETKSWAAVPYIKPFQTSFVHGWGAVAELNEQDLDEAAAVQVPYVEQI